MRYSFLGLIVVLLMTACSNYTVNNSQRCSSAFINTQFECTGTIGALHGTQSLILRDFQDNETALRTWDIDFSLRIGEGELLLTIPHVDDTETTYRVTPDNPLDVTTTIQRGGKWVAVEMAAQETQSADDTDVSPVVRDIEWSASLSSN